MLLFKQVAWQVTSTIFPTNSHHRRFATKLDQYQKQSRLRYNFVVDAIALIFQEHS